MSFAHAGAHQNHDEAVCLAEVAQDAIGLLALNRRNFEVQFFNLCDPNTGSTAIHNAWPKC